MKTDWYIYPLYPFLFTAGVFIGVMEFDFGRKYQDLNNSTFGGLSYDVK